MVVVIMEDSFLNMIRKGINVKSFFTYDGHNIPIRAISTVETDDAKYKSMGLVDQKLAKFILQMRLGTFKEAIDLSTVPPEMFTNYVRYVLEFDYWIVFHAMKDFRDSSFTIEDVRKMRHIHEIAMKAINMSSADTDFVIQFVRSEDGQELAKIIYELKQPLESAIWKLTPLQHEFLKWSNPNQPIKVAGSMEEFEKVLSSIGGAIGRR